MKTDIELQRELVLNEWKTLRKKYKLPPLEDLETKFKFTLVSPLYEISVVFSSATSYLLGIAGNFESFLNPQQVSRMIEVKALGKTANEEVTKMFKKLMAEIREEQLSSFQSETEMAKSIINGLKFFDKDLRPFLVKHFGELAKSWKIENEVKEEKKGYLG